MCRNKILQKALEIFEASPQFNSKGDTCTAICLLQISSINKSINLSLLLRCTKGLIWEYAHVSKTMCSCKQNIILKSDTALVNQLLYPLHIPTFIKPWLQKANFELQLKNNKEDIEKHLKQIQNKSSLFSILPTMEFSKLRLGSIVKKVMCVRILLQHCDISV